MVFSWWLEMQLTNAALPPNFLENRNSAAHLKQTAAAGL
jgi:hypothetical protein